VYSPARKNRYLNHLRLNGNASPRKIPLPVKTRWNTWFEMVFYTNEHIQYWGDFFNNELSLEPQHETLKSITSLLNSQTKYRLIKIYISFITIFAKQFVQDLDFFQTQNKPVFPYVESRLTNLTAYIQNNRTADFFGCELEDLINSLGFGSNDFYPIFRNAFEVAYNKFSVHIPQHPGRALFQACQIFIPSFFHTSDTLRKDIRHYNAITELQNINNELILEWGIYCGLEHQIFSEELDLNEYWLGLMQQLPLLSKIALDYIWLPISSCSVERSFSMYNSLLDSDRQNLSLDSLKSLNMLYYNSS
jgi:hAT family C-terminal dimerisation region